MCEIKNGADFTLTSEQSERLPLPHTKGTKPAPLLIKSIGLLFTSQEKTNIYFKYIFSKIVPREGLEPPRAYTHQILSQARLPIPPPRQTQFSRISSYLIKYLYVKSVGS